LFTLITILKSGFIAHYYHHLLYCQKGGLQEGADGCGKLRAKRNISLQMVVLAFAVLLLKRL
jgi:hypothetical protein